MKPIWQIVRKDLHRLRLPLALWIVVVVARLVLQAIASGLLGGAPKLELLGYVGEGSFMFARTAIDLVMAYLLAGWLVFEDPLVEPDAFWITRPISGARLLAAKLISAALIFVVMPVALTLPWWMGCGLGAGDIAIAAASVVTPIVLVAAFGMMCAALTDGFPRYLLWSAAGVATVVVLLVGAMWVFGSGKGGSGQFLTRLALGAFALITLSLVVICHQYLTRRLRRSIVVLVAGVLLLSGALSQSKWDITKQPPPGPEQAGDEKIQLKAVAHARYDSRTKGVVFPWMIEGLPPGTHSRVLFKGQWSVNGEVAWTKKLDLEYPDFSRARSVRQLLNLPDSPSVNDWNVMRPSPLTERLKREKSSFHASAEIHLFPGTLELELGLREQTIRKLSGSFSISDVQRNGDSISMTYSVRRLAYSPRVYSSAWRGGLALFHRPSGAFCLMKSEFGAYVVLDSVMMTSYRVKFTLPPGSALEDMVLGQASFHEDRVLHRTLDIDPYVLGEDIPAPEPKP